MPAESDFLEFLPSDCHSHLDGQHSVTWAILTERKSGKLIQPSRLYSRGKKKRWVENNVFVSL